MNFELKLLAKPLESDFFHSDRTSHVFIFIAFCIIVVFTLPQIESVFFQAARIIIVVTIIVFILLKINFRKEDEILKTNIIGVLSFDGREMTFTTTETTIIDKNFQGVIHFKFGGYNNSP